VAKRIAAATVDALGPHDLAAVVHTGTGTAQNFTRNRPLLLSAVQSPFMGGREGDEWATSTPRDRWLPPLSADSPVAAGDCPSGNCTLETLTRIAESLRDLPRRKSLIFIGTTIALQRKERPELNRLREQLFRALDVANLTVYPIDVKGLESLALDTTYKGSRPDPRTYVSVTAQSLIRQGDFKSIADRTGGRAIVNANDPDVIVPDIFRESGSYYTLGFVAASMDNRYHDIKVQVNRRDVSIHSRKSHYAGATERPPALENRGAPSDLIAAISSQWPRGDLPLNVSVAAFADPSGSKSIAALTVRLPATGTLAALAVAFDTIGSAVNSYWQTLDASAVLPPGAHSEFEVLFRLPLDPGRYGIRAAIRDGNGRIGSVYTDVDVPNFAKAPVSLSGVIVDAAPPTPSGPERTFDELLPFLPTARREFDATSEVRAFTRVHQGGINALEPVRVSTKVQDTSGRTVFERGRTLAVADFTARAADVFLNLPGGTFAPGEYLLTIEATLRTSTARRDVRFEVR